MSFQSRILSSNRATRVSHWRFVSRHLTDVNLITSHLYSPSLVHLILRKNICSFRPWAGSSCSLFIRRVGEMCWVSVCRSANQNNELRAAKSNPFLHHRESVDSLLIQKKCHLMHFYCIRSVKLLKYLSNFQSTCPDECFAVLLAKELS